MGVQVKVCEIKGKRIAVKCGAISAEVDADDLYYCVAEKIHLFSPTAALKRK